jgi:hypothetical protein
MKKFHESIRHDPPEDGLVPEPSGDLTMHGRE